MQAGCTSRGHVMVRFKDDMSAFVALMFLGRLQTASDNLMIWECRPF